MRFIRSSVRIFSILAAFAVLVACVAPAATNAGNSNAPSTGAAAAVHPVRSSCGAFH